MWEFHQIGSLGPYEKDYPLRKIQIAPIDASAKISGLGFQRSYSDSPGEATPRAPSSQNPGMPPALEVLSIKDLGND